MNLSESVNAIQAEVDPIWMVVTRVMEDPGAPVSNGLETKIAQNFISLSSQEVIFHMGAQYTGYEKVASGHPDHFTSYYSIMCSEGEEVKGFDEVIDHLCKQTGEAWLETNSTLF